MISGRYPIPYLLLPLALLLGGCPDPDPPTGPDGSGLKGTMYFSGDLAANVYRVDLESGTLERLVAGRDPYLTAEGTLIVADHDGLHEVSLDGIQRRTIVAENTDDGSENVFNNGFSNPQVSPDGALVMYENLLWGDFFIVDRETGELIFEFVDPDSNVQRPSWTETGEIVFAGTSSNDGLYILDADWQFYSRFDPDLANPSDPAVSPDGTRVAFILNGDLYTMQMDGTDLKRLSESVPAESWPVWSPDGTRIAAYGNKVSVLVFSSDGGEPIDLRDLSSALEEFFRSRVSRGNQFFWK